ncbi:MAG: hypothetical protein U9P73_06005 [Candidatus Cloacimonadota bacterium]|nr:hypothetical protein [Candidatus Cloacimonadota bacterium]
MANFGNTNRNKYFDTMETEKFVSLQRREMGDKKNNVFGIYSDEKKDEVK